MLFPIVMVVVLLIVHVALWAHANAVAQGAAEHGAEVAALYASTIDDAQQATLDYVDRAGQVDDVVATITTTPNDVTVTVTGTYPSVFGTLAVEATTTLVRERVPEP